MPMADSVRSRRPAQPISPTRAHPPTRPITPMATAGPTRRTNRSATRLRRHRRITITTEPTTEATATPGQPRNAAAALRPSRTILQRGSPRANTIKGASEVVGVEWLMWGQPPPAVPGAQLRKVLTLLPASPKWSAPPVFTRPDSRGAAVPHECYATPTFFCKSPPSLRSNHGSARVPDLQDWFPVPHTGTGYTRHQKSSLLQFFQAVRREAREPSAL